MKTKNIFLLLALFAATTFAACEKDKDEPALNPTEQKLVKTWKLEALTMPKAGNPEVDSSIIQDCMEKITLTFNDKRSFEFVNPDTDCKQTVLPFKKGSWSITADGKQLTLKGDKTSKWTVETLDDNKLKATFRDSVDVNHNYLKTITLKK